MSNIYVIMLISIVLVIVSLIWRDVARVDVDLMVINARRHHIWTGTIDDSKNEFTEAFAIADGKFVAVGSTEYVKSKVASCKQVIDLSDKDKKHWFVTPGLHDAHVHLIGGGRTLVGVKLRYVKDKTSFIEQIQKYVEKFKPQPGEWVLGSEWSEAEYPQGQVPHKSWIDSVLPNNPAYFLRMDAHSCVVNSKALALANITKDTENMEGGFIEKDPVTGEPTGILKDLAMELIQRLVPPTDDRKALMFGMDQVVANGIVAVGHMGPGPFAVPGESWRDFELYQSVKKEGLFKVRVHTVLEIGLWKELAEYVQKHGRGDEWLTYGSLKTFYDGSLGSLTGLMLEPYEGTDNVGLRTIDPDLLYQVSKRSEESELQMITHAIGDKANREVLDIYERVFKESKSPNRDRRFRIEHAQHLHPDDVARFSELGIVVSVQPCHLTEDAITVERLVGDRRAKEVFAFRSIIDSLSSSKAKYPLLALGTDWFVAELSPLQNIHAAVTRKAKSHPNGFNPTERLTVREALGAYTTGSAYASFNEHRMGLIKEGYLGDVTVFSQNLLEIPEDDIPQTEVMATIVGGRVMFNATRDEKVL